MKIKEGTRVEKSKSKVELILCSSQKMKVKDKDFFVNSVCEKEKKTNVHCFCCVLFFFAEY